MSISTTTRRAPRRRRAQIERALQVPKIQEQFCLNFQAIAHLGTGKIIAYEALARWSTPELGPVSPAEFVPIAEQLHLIDDINTYLVAKAFEEATHWPEAVRLSFNLSAIQLCARGSAETLLEILAVSGLPAARLQVEVTETALLADLDAARANLETLRQARVTVVLDDFGAGFASIGYLRELRFDQIKLDGAIVTAAKDSADGKRLLSAVIGLCDILGVMTVAEHVESEELLHLLKELGCTAGQGFWLHRPAPPDSLAILHEGGTGNVLPFTSSWRRRAA